MTIPYSSPIPPLIGELKNVKIDPTTLANNDVIKFNQLENLWVNGVAGGGGGSQDLCSVLTQGDDACDNNIRNLNTLYFDPLTSITTTTPLGGQMNLSTNGSPALQISNTPTGNTRHAYTVEAPMFSPQNVVPDTNVGNGVDGIYIQSLRRGTINQQPFQQDFNNVYNFPQEIQRVVAQSVYVNSPNVIIAVGKVGFKILPGLTYIPKFGDINGTQDEMFYDPCNMRAAAVGLEFQQALVPDPFSSDLTIRGGHWISRFTLVGTFNNPIGNLLHIYVVQNRSGVFLREFEISIIATDTLDVATSGVHRILGWSNLPDEDIDNIRDTFYFEIRNFSPNDFKMKRGIFEFSYEVPH